MSSINPGPPLNASATMRGLVSTLAQTFAGVKTFVATIIASAGVQLSALWNTNGTGANDVGVKIGVSTNAHVNAKVVSFRDQIGGTENEIGYIQKTLGLVIGSSHVQPSGLGYFPVATYSNQFRPATSNSYARLNDSYNGNMTGATDVAVIVGTTTADGSVNVNGKLLSIGTGIGGTYVERAWFKKSGTEGFSLANGGGTGSLTINTSSGTVLAWSSTAAVTLDSNNVTSRAAVSVVGQSNAADGASAVAVVSNTTSAWSNAAAKLHSFRNGSAEKSAVMANGEFEHAVAGAGIVLKSPDGTRYRITVANGGTLSVTAA